MIRKIKPYFNRQNVEEVFRFGIVGLVVLVSYYFSLLFLIEVIKIHYLTSNIITVCITSIISFIGHKYITFHSHNKPSLQEIILFIIQAIVSFFVSSLILYSGYLLKLETRISALAVVITIPIINFFIMKFLVFKK